MPYGRAACRGKVRPPASAVPILQSWRKNTAAARSLRLLAHRGKGPAATQIPEYRSSSAFFGANPV